LLDDAVAAFLESVPERALDQPLIALLRCSGYHHIRLVHGSSEFGKDIIAQLDGEQWAFQSKAGDIGQGEFRAMKGQLDELRTYALSHPDFRTDLPRRAVLIFTGRFKGNGALSAQEYNRLARERSEPELEPWDADELIGQMTANPNAVLRGSVDGQLMSLLGAAGDDRADMDLIERFSRRWTSWESARIAGLGMIEAAILCETLRQRERLDLACHLSLCLLRAVWVARMNDEQLTLDGDAVASLFDVYAGMLWEECDDRLLTDGGLVAYSGPNAWATYQLRCGRVAELVGLFGLRLRMERREGADEVAEWLASFMDAHPAACRPLGDRYAVGLIPPVLLLAGRSSSQVDDILVTAAVWLCDRSEAGQLGLAHVEADPAEEIERVFGSYFEHIARIRRAGSQLAGVLLDLAALLGRTNAFEGIWNDVRAVDLYPMVLRTGDQTDWLLRDGPGNRWMHGVEYSEEGDGDARAPHLAPTTAEDQSAKRWWDYLAISAALRDRHFPRAIARAVATESSRPERDIRGSSAAGTAGVEATA